MWLFEIFGFVTQSIVVLLLCFESNISSEVEKVILEGAFRS